MSRMKWVVAIVVLLVLIVGGYVAGAWLRLYGEHEGPGHVTATRVPAAAIEARTRVQSAAAKALTVGQPKQILFG
ncbi:MAG TPA: hypothetical protein VL403_11800, partial [Candidatus Kryptonia bacterium]|nr:hypothetical protein [Candidatus Kryptonia bacterium]